MEKITITFLVLMFVASLFIFCNPTTDSGDGGDGGDGGSADVFEISWSGCLYAVVKGTEIKLEATSFSHEKVDIYLFTEGNSPTKQLDIEKGLALTNHSATTTWTVPEDLVGEFKFRAYKGGEDVATSELYADSEKIEIVSYDNVAKILFKSRVSLDPEVQMLLIMGDDDILLPNPDKPGTFTYSQDFGIENAKSLIPKESGAPMEDNVLVKSGKYDWFILFFRNKEIYSSAFSTPTEINNQHAFEAGEDYLIAPETPAGFGVSCVKVKDMINIPEDGGANVKTATVGDTDVTITVTGTNFKSELHPEGLLTSRSENDLEIKADSVTINTDGTATLVFDIPDDAPASNSDYTIGEGENQTTHQVEWHLRMLQAGGYAYLGEFTINAE